MHRESWLAHAPNQADTALVGAESFEVIQALGADGDPNPECFSCHPELSFH